MAHHRPRTYLPWHRVVAAVLFACGAMALQWALWPFLRPFVGALSYPALLASVWIGGVWGGLLSTGVAATIIYYVFMAPEWSWRVANPNNLLALAVFIGLGIAFSLTDHRLRVARARLASRLSEDVDVAESATIFALSRLAESRDGSTGRHLDAVQNLCCRLASTLQSDPSFGEPVTDAFIENLRRACVLHDVGKVGIPDEILLKPGSLTADEFEIVKTHVTIGAATLQDVLDQHPGNALLEMGVVVARWHHERWAGDGYPDQLPGTRIPLAARIMAVADVYEALRSARCYKPAMSHGEAVAVIRDGSGTQFDPSVVRAFLSCADEFEMEWVGDGLPPAPHCRQVTEHTRRIAAERKLAASEARFAFLTENMKDVVWTLDPETMRFTYVSPSVFHLRGYTAEEVMAESMDAALTSEGAVFVRGRMTEAMQLFAASGLPLGEFITAELEQPCKDGSVVWTEVITRYYRDETTGRIGIIGVTRDITDRKRAQDELLRQANTDDLTGVATRRRFIDRADEEIERSRRYGHHLTLVTLDLDELKRLNDTYGHAAGDEALQLVVEQLRAISRGSDLVGRLGGDEFALLMPETAPEGAHALMKRARENLESCFMSSVGETICVSFSFGACALSEECATLDEMLARADADLYRDKQDRAS